MPLNYPKKLLLGIQFHRRGYNCFSEKPKPTRSDVPLYQNPRKCKRAYKKYED